jgi:hypothetical protein
MSHSRSGNHRAGGRSAKETPTSLSGGGVVVDDRTDWYQVLIDNNELISTAADDASPRTCIGLWHYGSD